MYTNIKQRSKDIMKADMATMLIGTGIFAAVNMLAAYLATGYIGSFLSGLLSTLSSACAACFYFRAYNRGKGDVYDTYALFTDSINLSKALTIMMAMWIINTLLTMAMTALAIIPLVGAIAAMIMAIIVSFLLRIVWYLFVANPQYPTGHYLKGSADYMGGNFVNLLVFSFSVTIVPALIELAVSIFVGSTIANILCLPLEAYISLAMAGYFAQLIPDEWYAGRAMF